MTGDSLTVLHSVNRRHATKRIARNPKTGEIKNRSYDREYHFRVEIIALGGFAALCATLTRLTAQLFAFVIRGVPVPGINLAYTRRLLHRDRKSGDPATFMPATRHWFAIDMDHVPAAAESAIWRASSKKRSTLNTSASGAHSLVRLLTSSAVPVPQLG